MSQTLRERAEAFAATYQIDLSGDGHLQSPSDLGRAMIADAIERFVMASAVSLDEVRQRGMDQRMHDAVMIITQGTLPDSSNGKLTADELWALGFGPSCPCGERGMAPDEEIVDDICAMCREAEDRSTYPSRPATEIDPDGTAEHAYAEVAGTVPESPCVLSACIEQVERECPDCGSRLNEDGECLRDLAEREHDDQAEARFISSALSEVD